MHEKRNLNRWKEPPWTARRASKRRSTWTALALGCQALASRCRAPDVSRRLPAVTAAAAPADPRTSRLRARNEGERATAAERIERCGSGAGRADSPAKRSGTGWGWETNAMRLRILQFLTPVASSISDNGKLLAALENLYLQPASTAGRFIRRCSSASLHSAAGPLRGHRPVEAPSALHHLNCRVSFDTWRHGSATPSSSFKGPTRGLPG